MMMTQRCLNADDDDAYAETTNDPCTTTLVGGRVYNQNSIAASAPPSRQATRNKFSPQTPKGDGTPATSASHSPPPPLGAATAFKTPPHERAPGTR